MLVLRKEGGDNKKLRSNKGGWVVGHGGCMQLNPTLSISSILLCYSDLLIVEQVHGQFFMKRKLLDTLPAIVGILQIQKYQVCSFNIHNPASDKIVRSDLYQSQSLQSNQFVSISSMVVA